MRCAILLTTWMPPSSLIPPITLGAIANVTVDLNFLILCPLSDILVNGVHKPASNDQQSMKAFGQISEDFCIVLATLLAR